MGWQLRIENVIELKILYWRWVKILLLFDKNIVTLASET